MPVTMSEATSRSELTAVLGIRDPEVVNLDRASIVVGERDDGFRVVVHRVSSLVRLLDRQSLRCERRIAEACDNPLSIEFAKDNGVDVLLLADLPGFTICQLGLVDDVDQHEFVCQRLSLIHI